MRQTTDRKRTRRDWILLPLIGLLTAVAMLGCAEWLARRMFKASKTNWTSCLAVDDSKSGVRGIPNCEYTQKIFESELTKYDFDKCGYRTGMDCARKAPGAYRIVLLGTSMAEGWRVQWDETFAARLPQELRQRTGRQVEVYNEGILYGTPHRLALRFGDVVRAQPDLILWALTPWDIEHVSEAAPPQETAGAGDEEQGKAGAGAWRWATLVDLADKKLRTIFLLRHFLYASETEYVRHFLMGEGADFLRSPPSAAWQSQLEKFDSYTAEVAAKARAAGLPIVATVLPERAQAAMISTGRWPAGYDPYAFGEQVRTVIERHGGRYIDVLRGFRGIANPEQYYLAVDGHPQAQGHAIFAQLLAKGLTGGPVAELYAAKKPRSVRAGKGVRRS